nr:aminotransferase class I/II-fold pyridoxal phosphate-dependent enzyme [Frisingicoccus sp.]
MKFHYAKRLDSFQAGIFAILNEKKDELVRQGREVFNLSVGTPDFKPAPHVMEAFYKACQDPENYKYSLVDIPELLQAVVGHYERRYGVHIEPEEIMSVNGSQEGIAHIALALCDAGDVVLVPNPGYPIFSIGPFLCGAEPVTYDLKPENHYMPDFSAIPADVAKKAKFMIVSYPLNPVCAAADDTVYEELIRFAKENDIIVLHDNAYSDIIYDGRKGGSFLHYEGAKDVGVEFYSLSKSYNLTGARISFVIGNKEIIQKFKTVRSQIDYGVFKPVQYGAIAALEGPQDAVLAQCEEYERRNKALCGGLRSIGWNVPDSEGTMFVWAPIPEGYTSSEEFCMDLVEKTGVLCTPGSSFGSLGEGYVRFALVRDVPTMERIVRVIDESGILKR